MPKITYRRANGSADTDDVPVGNSVMRGAVINGVAGILGECGGGGAMCGTCNVFVSTDNLLPLPPMSDIEDELLHGTATPRCPTSRLSCQLAVAGQIDGLVVDLPEKQQ